MTLYTPQLYSLYGLKQLLKHTRQKHKFSRTNASQASRRKINGNELSVVTFYAYLLCFVDDGCYGLSVRTVWPRKMVYNEIFAKISKELDKKVSSQFNFKRIPFKKSGKNILRILIFFVFS